MRLGLPISVVAYGIAASVFAQQSDGVEEKRP